MPKSCPAIGIAHSWEGYYGHFTLPNKKIKRCLIQKLDMKDTQVLAIWVKFQKKGLPKQILIDPMELAIMDIHWWNTDCASDDDEDPNESYQYQVPPPMRKLPQWNIPDLDKIAPDKKDAINFRICSINRVLSMFSEEK